jgi:transposase-like protein
VPVVVIGVREDGTKELLAVEDGYRESSELWAGVMRDLKARGANEPKLVVGDGALGTWATLRDVFPGARRQACWVHAIANVLDALPKPAAAAREDDAARDHGSPGARRRRPGA